MLKNKKLSFDYQSAFLLRSYFVCDFRNVSANVYSKC